MLLIVTDDRRLLLHHRDDKPGIPHPGCWSGFGGAIEAGETAGQALRREVLEETGLAVEHPVFLADEPDTEGDGRLVSLFYVVGGIMPEDIDLHEGAGVGPRLMSLTWASGSGRRSGAARVFPRPRAQLAARSPASEAIELPRGR
jgi:8-oxo-dGTP pyrophosphatase MutT (NUDIX family)